MRKAARGEEYFLMMGKFHAMCVAASKTKQMVLFWWSPSVFGYQVNGSWLVWFDWLVEVMGSGSISDDDLRFLRRISG